MKLKLSLALLGIVLAAFISAQFGLAVGLVLLTLIACALNRPQARCCTITLSVPEILGDLLKAFRTETPELFGRVGFARDFSSRSAVLGDKITAKISHVPATAMYDPTPKMGFYAGAQDVTTLIEDVPVTLDQLRIVTVKIGWLTALATRGVPLYRAAVNQLGYALGKYVVDTALAASVAGVSNSINVSPLLVTLDTMETLRNQCNSQGMENNGRFAFISNSFAASLGCDDRIRSALFYGDLNAKQGYRIWNNLAGFSFVKEYQDLPLAGSNLVGLIGDRRLCCVAVRKIRDLSNVAEQLNIPKTMDFVPLTDADSGVELMGVSWQDGGTGDLYLGAAVLFGVGAGCQGGLPGTMTDEAGCAIYSL